MRRWKKLFQRSLSTCTSKNKVHSDQTHPMEYSAENNLLQKSSEERRDSQDHLASDTTDDEQEDLPYDGILECYLVPRLQHDEVEKSSTTVDSHQASISFEESPPETTNDEALYSLFSSDLFSLSETVSNPITQAEKDIEHENETSTVPSKIPDVLLRHMTKDNLLNPSEFIHFETMPDISMLDSSDETAVSRKSGANLKQCPSDEEQEDFKEEYLEMYREENNGIQENTTDEFNSDIDETSPKGSDEENECELIQKNVDVGHISPDDVDNESKQPRYEPHRRPSYEMKYGQGQVHYKLPDFSKVPPRVKIPKGDNVASKPGPTMKKAATSTNLIEQSFVIQDILDSMQPGQIMEDSLFLDQRQEQALIDFDFNNKVNAVSLQASECFLTSPSPFLLEKQSEVASHGLQDNGLEIPGRVKEPENLEGACVLSEGEKLTGLLMEQAQTLKIKVEHFCDSLLKKSLPRKEQVLVFQDFKSCLETLEIDYLSTKEKHRDLQLQIYRTGSQTVGDFDTEREVEGQIFRLGMLLEDIQEQINKNEENETESSSSTCSGEALVLSHTQVKEDVNDLTTNNDKVVSWSPNCTTLSQTQGPMKKEDVNNLHQLFSRPDTTAIVDLPGTTRTVDHPDSGTVDNGLMPVLSDHSAVNRDKHLTRQEAAVISSNIVPLILSGSLCNPLGQNPISQVEYPEDWTLSEHSEFAEETRIAGKLEKDIGECPLHIRYQGDEIRKNQRKFRKPKELSIFVQEKDMILDTANCNGTQDSSSSGWLVSSHSGLVQCRSKSPICDRTNLYEASSGSLWKKYSNGRVPTTERPSHLLNPEMAMKEYPKEKSLRPSKLPLCIQSQRCPSTRLQDRRSNISHHVPSSRSSGRSSVSQHSQLARSTVTTLQRNRWRKVKPNSLDYRDNKILNNVLDNALRTAKNMQKTSERMVQKLAAELVNPMPYRSFYTGERNSKTVDAVLKK